MLPCRPPWARFVLAIGVEVARGRVLGIEHGSGVGRAEVMAHVMRPRRGDSEPFYLARSLIEGIIHQTSGPFKLPLLEHAELPPRHGLFCPFKLLLRKG